MASSCVLRATGNEFDVTEFLRSSMLEPVNVFTRGERKTESKVWDTSGITVDVSDGETFEEQVTDAIAFIKSHRDELGLLKDDMGVEHTGLDFGVFLRDSVVQSYTFPLELVHLASEGSLSLELSIYVNDQFGVMTNERVFAMSFAGVYPHYVGKVEKKGCSVAELHEVIEWLTGFVRNGSDSDWALVVQAAKNPVAIARGSDLTPRLNPNVALITGVVCGVRVEDIEDPLMQKIRWLDKLVDELAKGKKMEKILRAAV